MATLLSHTAVIWAIFSSSVMRAIRSSTRASTGAAASLYTGRADLAAAGAAASATGAPMAQAQRSADVAQVNERAEAAHRA
jgi:hypothetical protein